MHALEAARYVLEVRYNQISIGVLYEERCQIQVQQGIITVSQGDRVILKGKKCEELYKLKEENSVRSEILGISLKGSSSRGGASRKFMMRCEPGQSVTGKRKSAFKQSPR